MVTKSLINNLSVHSVLLTSAGKQNNPLKSRKQVMKWGLDKLFRSTEGS